MEVSREGPRAPEHTVRVMVLEALADHKPVRLGFRGSSMRPLLHDGDRIRVAPRAGPPRPGDVVLYLSGEVFVAHRVIRRVRRNGRTALLVKGDFTAEGTRVLFPRRVLGLVSSRERNGAELDLRSPRMKALGAAIAWASPWAVRHGLALPRFLRHGIRRFLFRLFGLLG